MKTRAKKIVGIILVVIMICCITCSVSAEGKASCIQHGPWIDDCAGHAETRHLSHNFTYLGYPKLCEYLYVLYTTKSTCKFCAYETTVRGPHSHGYLNHFSDQYGSCGWSNDSRCRLVAD